MSEDEQWGGVPRTVWFCGMHGTEPTGPANVCTCFPDEIAVQLPRLTDAQADALYEVAASRVDVTQLALDGLLMPREPEPLNEHGLTEEGERVHHTWQMQAQEEEDSEAMNPSPVLGQLDDLAEAIADMLDAALHPEACWISPTETNCSCLIGDVRAALPQCTYESLHYRCLRTVHPSTPDLHYYGDEKLTVGQDEPTPADYGDATYREMAVTAAEEHRAAQRSAVERDEALRELLSHARTQSTEVRGHYQSTDGSKAYDDMADRLAKILDGEL